MKKLPKPLQRKLWQPIDIEEIKSKKVKKILLRIFFILIIALCLFVLLKNLIVRHVLIKEVEKGFGIKVTIRDLDVSFTGAHLSMKGVTLYNPPGFVKTELAYIPEIQIVFNPFELLFNKKMLFYYVGIQVERFNAIKNRDKLVNFSTIKLARGKDAGHEGGISIFLLHFLVHDVYYIDYTPKGKPKTRRFNLDYNVAFKNVDSYEDIANVFIYHIVSQTKLAKVLGVTLVPLSENIKDIVMIPGKAVQNTIKSVLGLPFSMVKQK